MKALNAGEVLDRNMILRLHQKNTVRQNQDLPTICILKKQKG